MTVDYHNSVQEVFLETIMAFCTSYKRERYISSISLDHPTLEDYYSLSLLLGRRMGFTGTQLRTLDYLLKKLWTSETLDCTLPSEKLEHSPISAVGFNQARLKSEFAQWKEEYSLGVQQKDIRDMNLREDLTQSCNC